MNFLRQGFRKLSYANACVDTSSLDEQHHVRHVSQHANLMALLFIEPQLWAIKVHIAEIGIFDLFCFYDLDLDPMTLYMLICCELPGDSLDV